MGVSCLSLIVSVPAAYETTLTLYPRFWPNMKMKSAAVFCLLVSLLVASFTSQVNAKPSIDAEGFNQPEEYDVVDVAKKACKQPGQRCNQNTFGKSECCGTFSFCILSASYDKTICS